MRLNTSTRKDSVINSDREGGNFEEKEEKKKDCPRPSPYNSEKP